MHDDDLRAMLRGAAAAHATDVERIRRAEQRLSARARTRRPAGTQGNRRVWAAVLAVPAVAVAGAAVVVAADPALLGSLLSRERAVPVVRPVAGSPALPLGAAQPPPTQPPGLIGEPAVASPSDVASSPAPTSAPVEATPSATPSSPPSRSVASPPQTIGSASPTPSPEPAELCEASATQLLAPYYLSNNLWNASAGTGEQCVRALSAPGQTVSWSTRWTWSGSPATVKSFASVVLGWHWGWRVQGTGLPIRLDEERSIPTRWDFEPRSTAPGGFDASYDMWFHAKPNPQWNDTPTAEMRIVPYSTGLGAPAGTPVSRVTIGGATWDLYVTQKQWPVYSFVRTAPATSVEADLRDFTDVLREQQRLQDQMHLSSIEAGVDVLSGSGELVTSAYSVEIGPPGGQP